MSVVGMVRVSMSGVEIVWGEIVWGGLSVGDGESSSHEPPYLKAGF